MIESEIYKYFFKFSNHEKFKFEVIKSEVKNIFLSST